MPGPLVERGDRVTLRTVEREDVPFLQRAFADPALRYPLGNPTHVNQEQVEERFEDDSHQRFLACIDGADATPGQPDEDETTPIGVLTVVDLDWSRTDLAYWLVPEHQGEGYGAEAVSLVVDNVFRTIDTPSLGATAFDFNDASRGLLESLGFTEEGRERKARYVDGEYRDAVRYGILREEWRERGGP
jgi:RimJ/RimL family protein N-acetyltransferase